MHAKCIVATPDPSGTLQMFTTAFAASYTQRCLRRCGSHHCVCYQCLLHTPHKQCQAQLSTNLSSTQTSQGLCGRCPSCMCCMLNMTQAVICLHSVLIFASCALANYPAQLKHNAVGKSSCLIAERRTLRQQWCMV